MARSVASKLGGKETASAYLQATADVKNWSSDQLAKFLGNLGLLPSDFNFKQRREKEDAAVASALKKIDSDSSLSSKVFKGLGLETPQQREQFKSGKVTAASGTTPASRAANPSQNLGYNPATGKVEDKVQVSSDQVRALYDSGEQVPQYAVDAVSQGKATPYSQAPRTLSNMDSTGGVSTGFSSGSSGSGGIVNIPGKSIYETNTPEALAAAGYAPKPGTENSTVNPLGITQEVLDGLHSAGYTINPNVEITPQRAAEFMAMAEKNISAFLPYAKKEIAPFYQNQLKIARESFLNELGYSRDEILRQEQDLEKQYGTGLRNIGEVAAEQGFAQSGLRRRDERDLATDTQKSIDTGRRQLEYGASNAARQFSQLYGSGELQNLDISKTPNVTAGQSGFTRSSGNNQLYQLSDDIYDNLTGSQQFAQRAQEEGRASELESAYRSYSSVPSTRTL